MTSARPVALVTGASRGIGRHLALALAAAGHDLALVATDRGRLDAVAAEVAESAQSEERPEPSVLVLPLDVTDDAAVQAAVERVLGGLGRLDVVVNAAGIVESQARLWEQDPQEWWRTIEVNVRGPFLVTRAVVPHLLAAGGGRIINLNSGSGTRGDEVNTAYHASKTALARLTEAVDLGAGTGGVKAFDLMPGVVRTDMTEGMPRHEGRSDWTDPDDVVELALALADGRLDAWSGRFVRAGVDTVEALLRAAPGLRDGDRQLRLQPWGEGDPLG